MPKLGHRMSILSIIFESVSYYSSGTLILVYIYNIVLQQREHTSSPSPAPQTVPYSVYADVRLELKRALDANGEMKKRLNKAFSDRKRLRPSSRGLLYARLQSLESYVTDSIPFVPPHKERREVLTLQMVADELKMITKGLKEEEWEQLSGPDVLITDQELEIDDDGNEDSEE